MKIKFISVLIILILIISLSGCKMPGLSGDEGEDQGDQVLTAAAETVDAHMTEQVISSALTLQAEVEAQDGEGEAQDEGEEEGEGEGEEPPTEEPVVETTEPPPPTEVPTNTNTPEPAGPTPTDVPCNKADFITDVTIPDDTEIAPGATFDKIWRLKNVGSCEWTTGYDLVYDHGDRMNAPDDIDFTGSVQPGQTVDLAVSLTAPTEGGTYRADFKLRSSDGIVFGIGDSGNSSFYVRIVVDEPTVTPTSTETSTPTPDPRPDLHITGFVLDPSTPTKGDVVHVTITVMNQGNSASGPYTVEWWAGSNYSTPACSWPVSSSNPGGGRVLECDYAGYPSTYASITTVAKVDPAGVVDESDETNNESSMVISVDP